MKQEKTNNDFYKEYRLQYIFARILTYISLITPTLILVGVNFEKYFPLDTDKNKISFGLSVGILLFCLCIAVVQVVKKIEDKKFTLFINSIYWLAFAFLSVSLEEVFNDIGSICTCIAAGMFLCASFNLFADNRKKWLEAYRTGMVNAKTMKNEDKKKGEIVE